jgi:hypothetical protein
MANIRPNCPPPKRPIVEPGGMTVSMPSNLRRSGTLAKRKIRRSEEKRPCSAKALKIRVYSFSL